MKKKQGCMIRLGLGGCLLAALLTFGVAFGIVAMIGGGDQNGEIDANIAPGQLAPAPPPAPPCLCSPTPVHTPTPAPTMTPLPTWPLPPTPNPGDPPPPPPPPDPNQTPPPDLTATASAYDDQLRRWQANATQIAGQWQETVVAGYATETALVPSPTPTPLPPIGGAPYGWPIDQFCDTRQHPDCIPNPNDNGRRYITQDFGCTWLGMENSSAWCGNDQNHLDSRFNVAGQPNVTTGGGGRIPGEIWVNWHTGVDLATGLGEPCWTTLDGVIQLAGYGRGGNTGYGLHVIIEDQSGIYGVLYGHLSALGEAVDLSTGRDLGRKWQVGDRIRPYTSQGLHIIVGYSGSTGNSTGNHLHYTIYLYGTQGTPDIDPWPFIARGSPQDPIPTPLAPITGYP